MLSECFILLDISGLSLWRKLKPTKDFRVIGRRERRRRLINICEGMILEWGSHALKGIEIL